MPDQGADEGYSRGIGMVFHLSGSVKLNIDSPVGQLKKIVLVRIAVQMAQGHSG